MKTYFKFLLRRWIDRLRHLVWPSRPVAAPLHVTSEEEERPRQPRLRYIPIWVGSQIFALPLIGDQKERKPGQDFYDET